MCTSETILLHHSCSGQLLAYPEIADERRLVRSESLRHWHEGAAEEGGGRGHDVLPFRFLKELPLDAWGKAAWPLLCMCAPFCVIIRHVLPPCKQAALLCPLLAVQQERLRCILSPDASTYQNQTMIICFTMHSGGTLQQSAWAPAKTRCHESTHG